MWEEAFTFLIHNPKSQELEVEVLKRHLSYRLSCLVWLIIIPSVSGEGREARVFVGDVDAASESPAGGRRHDAEPAFPAEELRTELHP